jgi:DnaD/phage-associated family protein
VAHIWEKKGIKNVAQAKEANFSYQVKNQAILKALGLMGDKLAPSVRQEFEKFVNKWNKKESFSIDVIVEACGRAMLSIKGGEPSPKARYTYAASILKNWKEQGVKDLKDIEAVDNKHTAEIEKKYKVEKSSGTKAYVNTPNGPALSKASLQFAITGHKGEDIDEFQKKIRELEARNIMRQNETQKKA